MTIVQAIHEELREKSAKSVRKHEGASRPTLRYEKAAQRQY
jgi:hypothetical protein